MKFLSEPFKQTLLVRAMGFAQIPLLAMVSPSVIELTSEKCVVKIPLKRRTRNHLKSMYFGALCIGADCAGGLIAVKLIRDRVGKGAMKKYSLAFKDFKAEFLKRPEGDVYFTCTDGTKISQMVEETGRTGERVTRPIQITATVPKISGNEPVALFELSLSLKRR